MAPPAGQASVGANGGTMGVVMEYDDAWKKEMMKWKKADLIVFLENTLLRLKDASRERISCLCDSPEYQDEGVDRDEVLDRLVAAINSMGEDDFSEYINLP